VFGPMWLRRRVLISAIVNVQKPVSAPTCVQIDVRDVAVKSFYIQTNNPDDLLAAIKSIIPAQSIERFTPLT